MYDALDLGIDRFARVPGSSRWRAIFRNGDERRLGGPADTRAATHSGYCDGRVWHGVCFKCGYRP
jgi:hypothetical protein